GADGTAVAPATAMHDVRLAFRSLFKTPGFTIGAVLTIAVGIGANTALFSVFDRLVLRPTTLADARSLAAIWVSNQSIGLVAPAVAWPRYEDIAQHSRSFTNI